MIHNSAKLSVREKPLACVATLGKMANDGRLRQAPAFRCQFVGLRQQLRRAVYRCRGLWTLPRSRVTCQKLANKPVDNLRRDLQARQSLK